MIEIRKCITCLLILLPWSIFGQNYADFSPTLKEKIDQNKQEGKPIYSGIETVYTLTVANVNAVNQPAVIASLSADSDVKEYSFTDESKTLTLVCVADYPIENIKSHLSAHGAEINHFVQIFRLQQ